jgi:hypothetical protein
MHGGDEKIGYLKKVNLEMEWDGERGPFDFVFGIGVDGLSPFEIDLEGKGAGYESAYHLTRAELNGLFQHLLPPLFLCDIPEAFTLKIRVVGIGQADQREVIKAMAEASSCGSDCCGGH